MKIQKFVYDNLIEKYDLELVTTFVDHFKIIVDDTHWVTDYINADWWESEKPANRKLDVRNAWVYFNELACEFRKEHNNWKYKYTNLFYHWRNLTDANKRLPELKARLTKPLNSYVSERRNFSNGWGRVYKNKKAEAVRQCGNTIRNSNQQIGRLLKISDVPPEVYPEIEARWEFYTDVLKHNPTKKRKPKKAKVEIEPIVNFISATITTPELLTIVRQYPRTTTYTKDPNHFLLFEGYIIKTQDLYDLMQASGDSKLDCYTKDGQLIIEHYNEHGVVWATSHFNMHPEWNEDNFIEVKHEINIGT